MGTCRLNRGGDRGANNALYIVVLGRLPSAPETFARKSELGDVNPSKYHVTVPVGRRIRKAGGEGYFIHHQHLRPEQVT